MKLKHRVYLLPVVAAVIFAVVIVIVGALAANTSASIRAVGTTDTPYLDAATGLHNEVGALVGSIQSAVAEGSADRLDDAKEHAAGAGKLVQAIGALDGKAATAGHLQGLVDNYTQVATQTALIMLGKAHGDQSAAVAAMQAARKALDDAVSAAVADARHQLDDGIERSGNGVRGIMLAIMAGALVIVAGLGLGSWQLVRSVWQQIGGEPDYARDMLVQMARGDLSRPVAVRPGDGQSLLAALAEMSKGLSGIVASVRLGSDQMATASSEIAGGNQDLSARTEQQASALQSTASSVEQLTRTVQANSDSAAQANQLAGSASLVAQRGGEVVTQVVHTMEEINASSKKIGDIIGVIDGIAFQTNILALNAAVEAARAGDQGRGFAVVASEVRSLAQRSATAAREIKSLVGTSIDRVEAGSRLVAGAGTTMTEIVASVGRLSAIIGEIVAAAGEQNDGIGQVGTAVHQLDQMTQQNAALVEESAAATESLRDQAARLAALVATFKLD